MTIITSTNTKGGATIKTQPSPPQHERSKYDICWGCHWWVAYSTTAKYPRPI